MLLVQHPFLSEYGTFTQEIFLVLVGLFSGIYRKKLGVSHFAVTFPFTPPQSHRVDRNAHKLPKKAECNALFPLPFHVRAVILARWK